MSELTQYLEGLALPAPPPVNFGLDKAPKLTLDSAKDQATVVGSEVIAFVRGVSRERRNDLVNASLLAQLVANKNVPDREDLTQVTAWYKHYFEVLAHLGFAIQVEGLAKYTESSEDFEAHEAVLEIAGQLLAGQAALAVVQSTLEALRNAAENAPWITLFNRASRSAQTARFQVSLASEDEEGQLKVRLMTFGMETVAQTTQVLFFKFHKNDAKFHYFAGEATIAPDVLDSARETVAGRLVRFTNEFIAGLPEL